MMKNLVLASAAKQSRAANKIATLGCALLAMTVGV